jgi:hypothetical protein
MHEDCHAPAHPGSAPMGMSRTVLEPPRSSARHGAAVDGSMATDEDTLTKAMRRKAASNLDTPGTIKSSKSFLPFSSHQIASKLNSVGVSLGNCEKEIFVSTNALKHMEFDRLKVSPICMSKSDTQPFDDEELHAVDGQLLSHLVGDVSEINLDEVMLRSVYDLKASNRKSKEFSIEKNSKAGKKAKSHKSKLFSK